MKKFILIAGAAVFAATAPAAHPGNGHGRANGAMKMHGKAEAHSRQAHGLVGSEHGRLYAFDARRSCPPGLAKRNNGCMAPGQAKKYYNIGQRYNRNFGTAWSYDQIPQALRSRYSFDQSDRYYYRNGYLYQVDPKTMLVQEVVSALLR